LKDFAPPLDQVADLDLAGARSRRGPCPALDPVARPPSRSLQPQPKAKAPLFLRPSLWNRTRDALPAKEGTPINCGIVMVTMFLCTQALFTFILSPIRLNSISPRSFSSSRVARQHFFDVKNIRMELRRRRWGPSAKSNKNAKAYHNSRWQYQDNKRRWNGARDQTLAVPAS
jgi:hypothetical protein